MPNITISLDKDLLATGRLYAEKHQTSMNALIRTLLEQTVAPQSKDWLKECFQLMDRANVSSQGQKWPREALYDAKNLGPTQRSGKRGRFEIGSCGSYSSWVKFLDFRTR